MNEDKAASSYRRRAEELRAVAACLCDPRAKGMLCGLAEGYERLAGIHEDIACRPTVAQA